jgi:hypothetical protein
MKNAHLSSLRLLSLAHTKNGKEEKIKKFKSVWFNYILKKKERQTKIQIMRSFQATISKKTSRNRKHCLRATYYAVVCRRRGKHAGNRVLLQTIQQSP